MVLKREHGSIALWSIIELPCPYSEREKGKKKTECWAFTNIIASGNVLWESFSSDNV